MIDWNLLKCAFNKHTFGEIIHDDVFKRWIKVCKVCGKTVKVDPPKKEDGTPFRPHEYMWYVRGNDHE